MKSRSIRRTKILATLGPSSMDKKTIQKLWDAGANAFRINMSHGDHAQWNKIITNIRKVSSEAAIIMDTKGPEIRLQGVKEEFAVTQNDELLFNLKRVKGMSYLSRRIDVKKGMHVLIDDGAIEGVVTQVKKGVVKIRTIDGGVVSNNRKVTFPRLHTKFPILNKKDKDDLEFCKKMKVDAIALSFTRRINDVRVARRIIGKDIMLITKIENSEGVDNMLSIVEAADGVMVARGDLGVEVSLEEVPALQKKIINLCNHKGKPVIVATQMLDSMTVNNRPTRAEVSDVANAVMDGADCVMLSQETAIGRYPVEAVSYMDSIARKTDSLVKSMIPHPHEKTSVADAISFAVFEISDHLDVEAIVSATSSGFTARMVARFRPKIPIIGASPNKHRLRQLQLSWGVIPLYFSLHSNNDRLIIKKAVQAAVKEGLLSLKDDIVATAGVDTMKEGSTNLIEVHDVIDLLKS